MNHKKELLRGLGVNTEPREGLGNLGFPILTCPIYYKGS